MDNTLAAKRAFSMDDMTEMRSVNSAQLSADGKLAVCVITSTINNLRKDDIYLIDLASGQLKNLTSGSAPQWSPDSTQIAYLDDTDGVSAIFIYDLKNNSREWLVNVYVSDHFVDHYANNNFCWSPDGTTIAYVSAAPLAAADEKVTAREFNNLLYKTKGGKGRQRYSDQQLNHIWLISIEGKKARPASKSESGQHSISWSPDGKQICFISYSLANEGINQWSDVFSLDVLTGETNQISREKGSSFQPAWSPDGQYIAYLGILDELSTNDSPAEDTQLYIVSSKGGRAKCLTSSLDRRIEQVSWSPFSQHIYFTAGNAGNTTLYHVSLLSGKTESIIDIQGKVTEYFVGKDGKNILYVHTDSNQPADLFIHHSEDHSNRKLTGTREELTGKCKLQPAETFWYKSFDDTDIQGWIMKPVDFNEHLLYPLILVIHGGPHNMFGYEFEDRMQVLSANGYAVLFINPRGSSGYGQQFSNGCVRAWGEGDYEDLMHGVDEIVKNNKWIDASRLGVTGQSYGGYMTNRIISKTKRFKAAVADGSICNLISFGGTSLYHSLMESEYRGPLHNNYELLWKCSPLKDVKNISTPVLFLHGETDNEVPFSQAEEMFIAVKKLGIETELVQYVGEGHGWRPDLSPGNRKDLLTRMLEWFNKYLNLPQREQ